LIIDIDSVFFKNRGKGTILSFIKRQVKAN